MTTKLKSTDRSSALIRKSIYISRDLSWIKFNHRVLDQARDEQRSVFERLKFLAITSSNLDEFFMIRVGSLYNYIDYGKERIDYSGLRELPFRDKLLQETKAFTRAQNQVYAKELKPLFEQSGFNFCSMSQLTDEEQGLAKAYFKKTVYPMLTPMVYDSYHTFPILMNQTLIFSVVTKSEDLKENRKLSFVQIPQNLPRFFEIRRADEKLLFVPIEEVIRTYIQRLFRNVDIESINLFRITRNGDFTLEESEDVDVNFLEEMKRKLRTRRTGRVVRLQVEHGFDKRVLSVLMDKYEIEQINIFETPKDSLIDFTSFWAIVSHPEFKPLLPQLPPPVTPLSMPSDDPEIDLFEVLKERDILLHSPYNSIDPLINLLERAAYDPKVLAIKITIYRLAKESRVTAALLQAAENGKHVSVLFEVKARFDEENNIREAQRLQKAGIYVIYGVSSLKTHTKLMMIVRKEEDRVTRYVHLSSGNYNEDTARIYTDLGVLSNNKIYAHDVSEFFNVITGHSDPERFDYLITAPKHMRTELIDLIRHEAANAQLGLPSGIVIKINSLQDAEVIDELYKASQAGVPIKLIVRGICCIRPGRKKLSENISVISIVGEFLEHSRIYYFHQNGDPKVYSGSADVMVRSFDRRVESLFLIVDPFIKKQTMNILRYNLQDNVNAYVMDEEGNFHRKTPGEDAPFNIHKEFFKLSIDDLKEVALF